MKKLLLYTFFLLIILFSPEYFTQDLSEIKIGVVYSERTKSIIYPHDQKFYPIQDWELFFLNRKISYTVIKDEGLDDNDFEELDVLILPSVEILSKKASENLKEFLANGKGLFILGNFGTHDKEGEKNITDFLLENTGFSYKFLDIQNKIAERHTLPITSPICRNLIPGTELLIMNQYQPLAVNNVGNKVKPLGEYLLQSDDKNEMTNSGIVLSERNKGRIIWFGFQLSQIIGDKSQQLVVEKLIYNTIDWLSNKPILMLTPWPENYQIPVLIINEITDIKALSNESLEQYYSNEISSNFFFDPGLIKSSGALLSKFSDLGDINLFLPSGMINNSDVDLVLDNEIDVLKKYSKQKYFGVKLDSRQSDHVLKNLSRLSLDFVIFYNNSLYVSGSLTNVNLPFNRLINSAIQFSITGKDKDRQLKEFKQFYSRSEKNGEPIFIDHPKSSFNGYRMKIFKKIVDYLREQMAWITNYSELIDWLLIHENVTISTRTLKDENEYEIKIENRNQTAVSNLNIMLLLPSGKHSPQLLNSSYQLEYNTDIDSHVIFIPYLRAGTKEIFKLGFKE